MFVSHKYKLLFFEVPRTASRSITRALTLLDPHSPTAAVRAVRRNLYHYHVFDPALLRRYPDYPVIAVHRNPYQRLQSHFKYRKQYGNPDELKSFTFEQYLRWVCFGDLPCEIAAAMVDRPITELIPRSDVDHWLAFDRLEEDWAALSDHLSIDFPKLAKINSSRSDLDDLAYYTPTLASWVKRRFAADFSEFGYSTDPLAKKQPPLG